MNTKPERGIIMKAKRFVAAFLCLCMTALLLAGCGSPADIESGAAKQDYPVKVNDVTIESQPEGVAVLSPNVADIILAMGYEINLKARSAECTQPDLKVLPEVTADDASKIKELGATVLFADSSVTKAQKDALSEQGITVLTFSPATTRSEFTKLYTQIGSVLAGGNTGYEQGEKTAENIFTTLDDIARIIPNSDVPSTAIYLTDTDGTVATGDSFVDILLSSAGFINGVKGETGGSVAAESIIRSNPQYIFCPTGLKEKLETTDGWKDMDAVKNGRVCEIEPELMQWQGRSVISAVSEMAGFAHPELASSDNSSDMSSSEAEPTPKPSETTEPTPTPEATPKPTETPKPTTEPTPTPDSTSYQQLQKGDTGSDVLKMQERLDELGYMFTTYDGTFDTGTEQAVMDFQLNNGYLTTGIARPDMLELLYSDNAVPAG